MKTRFTEKSRGVDARKMKVYEKKIQQLDRVINSLTTSKIKLKDTLISLQSKVTFLEQNKELMVELFDLKENEDLVASLNATIKNAQDIDKALENLKIENVSSK